MFLGKQHEIWSKQHNGKVSFVVCKTHDARCVQRADVQNVDADGTRETTYSYVEALYPRAWVAQCLLPRVQGTEAATRLTGLHWRQGQL